MTFRNGAVAAGSEAVNGGSTDIVVTTLPVGGDSLTATYDADSETGKSTSASVLRSRVSKSAVRLERRHRSSSQY